MKIFVRFLKVDMIYFISMIKINNIFWYNPSVIIFKYNNYSADFFTKEFFNNICLIIFIFNFILNILLVIFIYV